MANPAELTGFAMVNNVYKFRRIKWGDPREKLKVLSEDIQRRFWLDRLRPAPFWLMAAAIWFASFVVVTTAGVYVFS